MDIKSNRLYIRSIIIITAIYNNKVNEQWKIIFVFLLHTYQRVELDRRVRTHNESYPTDSDQ